MRFFAIFLLCASISFGDVNITPAARTFFETKIRPVLVERCFECHSASAKKLGGKLYLDTREALLKGGESGILLIPGKPDESLLLQALRHDGVEMPPETPLSDATVQAFHEWVRMGAPYPAAEAAKPVTSDAEKTASDFWSFQPIQKPSSPAPEQQNWSRDPLDNFVLARMEQAALKPGVDASAEQLIRRLSFDLVGLPPSFEQTQAFAKAAKQDRTRALEQLVDELLASRHFGERWGRHWLDVARYGESNGNDGLGRNATFPHAWRYRDYVIQAFNDDMPFDRFVHEQIAGDLLPAETPADQDRQHIATGFLAIGSKPAKAMNDNFDMDVVADQIDVVSRGFMGLSIACARCHDHKHDPIPARDYYALAGFFTNTETLWGKAANEKLTAPPTPLHELRSYGTPERGAPPPRVYLQLPVDYHAKVKGLAPLIHESFETLPTSLDAEPGVGFSNKDFARINNKRISGELDPSHQDYSVAFWFRNDLPNKSRAVTAYLFSRGPKGNKASTGEHIGISGNYQGKPEGRLFLFNGSKAGGSVRGKTVIPPRTWNHVVLVRKGQAVKLWLNGGEKPEVETEMAATFGEAKAFFVGARNDRFAPLDGNITEFALFDRALTDDDARKLHKVSGQPKGPGVQEGKVSEALKHYAMGVRDRKKFQDCKLNVKGESKKLGALVPRGFPSVLMPDHDACSPIPTNQSGRVELAHWITEPEHPLTARVMANRIWLHLFGQAIVATPDDFGIYGQRPTHPELLDHLATRFVEGEWSVKGLIRSIVLSRTYQLSSAGHARTMDLDPDNSWYSRHLRRRLDAESIRDSMLAVSGSLVQTPGTGSDVQDIDILLNWPIGEATNLHKPSLHRSVYLCMMRNAPPPQLAAFDLPDGVGVMGRRYVTTLPSQSLFLINSPFLVQQSESFAGSLRCDSSDDAQRISRGFERAFQRKPGKSEFDRALAFVSHPEEADLYWSGFCQALFMANEFRYVD